MRIDPNPAALLNEHLACVHERSSDEAAADVQVEAAVSTKIRSKMGSMKRLTVKLVRSVSASTRRTHAGDAAQVGQKRLSFGGGSGGNRGESSFEC